MSADEIGKPSQPIGSACGIFERELAAYFDGAEQTTVLRHAADCPACGAVLKDLQLIRAAARDIPLESPSPRVWKNVRTALAQEGLIRHPERHWLGWLRAPGVPLRYASATTAAAVAVLGAVFIFGPRLSRRPAPLASRADLAGSVSGATFTAEQASLADTVLEMEQTFKQREANLPPVIKTTYERGLASLDASIRESLDTVRRNPQDELARQFLMDAYTQKANVLASALEYDGD
jgi:hypothetical protein